MCFMFLIKCAAKIRSFFRFQNKNSPELLKMSKFFVHLVKKSTFAGCFGVKMLKNDTKLIHNKL